MSSIVSDFETWPYVIQVAMIVGLTAIGITLTLMLGTLLMRVQAFEHRHIALHVNAVWRPLLMQAVADGPVGKLPRLRLRDRMAFMLLWNQYQNSLSGRAAENLNHLAHRLNVGGLARRMARRRNLAHRTLGLATMTHMANPYDWHMLERLLSERRTLVSMAAARALLRVDAKQAAPLVIDEFLSRYDWPVSQMATLLRETKDPEVERALSLRIETLPPDKQVRLMPLVRVFDRRDIVESVMAQATDTALLEASLAQVSDRASATRVRELALHGLWRVRAFAAQALGRMGDPEDRALLIRLTSDRHWWVRYRAALAIVNQMGYRDHELIELCDSLDDRYSRDIIRHAWAERALRHQPADDTKTTSTDERRGLDRRMNARGTLAAGAVERRKGQRRTAADKSTALLVTASETNEEKQAA